MERRGGEKKGEMSGEKLRRAKRRVEGIFIFL
jgi:hypothetical protein